MSPGRKKNLASLLESYYHRYNRKRYISPDPLQLVFDYEEAADREVAGFISSSLALGRVNSIIGAAGGVLRSLGSPARGLRRISETDLRTEFSGFRYRFYSSEDLVNLLLGIGGVLRQFGSLENCFLSCVDPSDQTTLPALTRFVRLIGREAGGSLAMLPDPVLGSACKRLHLFLRWMIRHDAVDPGVWRGIKPAILVVPMDVHMHRISCSLGITERKQPDAKTAVEVTDFFRSIRPDDPVRYDFCLTRTAIHPQLRDFVF